MKDAGCRAWDEQGGRGGKAGQRWTRGAGTCWLTASLRGASTSSAPAPSMLLREAAAGTEVWARAGALRGRRSASEDRARSRGGSDSSSSAVRVALSSAGYGEGMSRRPRAVRREGTAEAARGALPQHDEIAA